VIIISVVYTLKCAIPTARAINYAPRVMPEIVVSHMMLISWYVHCTDLSVIIFN